MIDSRRGEHRRRHWANTGLDRFPDARQTGDERDEELDSVDRRGDADDPGTADDIQAGRKVADPATLLREPENGDGRRNVDTRGVSNAKRLREDRASSWPDSGQSSCPPRAGGCCYS